MPQLPHFCLVCFPVARAQQNIVACYQNFVEMTELLWAPPRHKSVEKLPFMPLEREIDNFVSVCGVKVATSLQLLKEIGM